MIWPPVPLEKLARASGGSTPKRNNDSYWNGDVPWVTPSDLPAPGASIVDVEDTKDHITQEGLNSCSALLLPPETVLFSSRATIGKIGIAKVPLATNQGFANFTPNLGVEPKYLAYALRYFTPQITALAGSTTFKEVSRGAIRKFQIPLPPPSEQKRIVEILDQADALQRECAEADAKKQRILPALFTRMFGDPATNPMGWPTAPMGDVVEIGTKLVDPNGSTYLDLPHIGGEEIEKNTGRILSTKLVRDSKLRSSKFHFTREHILYSKIRPYLNKVSYPGFEGLCSADIYPLRPKDNHTTTWYLVALLRSTSFLCYANLHSERLRMHKLNREQLGAFKTPLPDPELLEAFEQRAQSLATFDVSRFHRARETKTLFHVIIHRSFSGELTAKWRDSHTDELLREAQEQAEALETVCAGTSTGPRRGRPLKAVSC